MTSIDLAHEVGQSAAFFAAMFIAGSSLCRLGKKDLKITWCVLYTALFGMALWFMHEVIFEGASDKDVATVLMVAYYIFLTRRRWANGVPEVARRGG